MRLLQRGVEHVSIEDGRERVAIGDMEARICADHHMNVERVDVVAEDPIVHSSREDLLQQCDRRDVLTEDLLGPAEVLGPMDVLDADELDELLVRGVVIVGRLGELAQRFVRRQLLDLDAPFDRRICAYTRSRTARYRPSLEPK